MVQFLLKIMVAALGVYLTLIIAAYLVSDFMIFHPQYSRQPDPPSTFKLRTGDGTIISAIYLKNTTAHYTILFSYGNASSLGNCYQFLQQLNSLGFSVLAYDYHGYGTSQGKPSEKSLYLDIDAAYSYLTENLGVPPQRIIAFGQSLGGAVAMDLARRRKLAGLILESSFVSAFRVLTRIPILPFDKFENLRKMKLVTCPVLVIHGDSDRTIPLWHGQELFRAAPEPKRLVIIPNGDHNYIPPESRDIYHQALRDFIALLD